MKTSTDNSNRRKKIVLKLGGACNLQCKHCHCMKSSFEYNPDIIPFIKEYKPEIIRFSGGEPLLYYDVIKKVIEALPSDMQYATVTNGTKLNLEMVEYFNAHNMSVGFSYDGENDSRDHHLRQNWADYFKCDKRGMSILYSECNEDYNKLHNEITELLRRHDAYASGSYWLNFPHQTDYNGNEQIDRELAMKYCSIIGHQLETDFINYKNGFRQSLVVLVMAVRKWLKPLTVRGVRCCNEDVLPLTLDGRFLLCPYGDQFVGDIYKGVDWDLVESYLPKRCRTCPIKAECGNTCIANVSDNECYISKVMNRHIKKLLKKYGVTAEEIIDFAVERARQH
jgi:organic radical activating enzyme